MYEHGLGVPQNYEIAAEWYTKAARGGFGQANLARLYRDGHGAKQDDAEAIRLFRIAAENGEASAQSDLGVQYARGRGVGRDDVQAYKWFTIAMKSGDRDAQTNRNFVVKRMSAPQLRTQSAKLTSSFPSELRSPMFPRRRAHSFSELSLTATGRFSITNASIKSARLIDATPTEPMMATVVAGSKAGQMRPQEAKMNQQGVEIARRSAAAKLHPSNIHTSTFVQSLIAYLVGEVWTEPHIAELVCLGNGDLLAREDGYTGFLRILCTRRALVRAVLALSQMLGLSPRERTYLLQRIPLPAKAK